jgi:hypothetical protein
MKQQKIVESRDLWKALIDGWIVKFDYRNARKHCGYIVEKDNPVPSIDNVILIAARTLHQNSKIFTYTECENLARIQYSIELQNGVETDNEQPKINTCRKGFNGCDNYKQDSVCRCK